MSKSETLYDRRIIARSLKAGRISKKEYEQYLAGLQDASVKSAPLLGAAAELPEDDLEDEQDEQD